MDAAREARVEALILSGGRPAVAVICPTCLRPLPVIEHDDPMRPLGSIERCRCGLWTSAQGMARAHDIVVRRIVPVNRIRGRVVDEVGGLASQPHHEENR